MRIGPRAVSDQINASGQITTGATASATAAADKAKETFYVTRIVLSVTTTASATITFRDRNGSPVPIAVLSCSALGALVVDFGENGYPCTSGKGLDVVGSASGPAAVWTVAGYRRGTPGSPKTIAEASANV